jgi:hypothetical protein
MRDQTPDTGVTTTLTADEPTAAELQQPKPLHHIIINEGDEATHKLKLTSIELQSSHPHLPPSPMNNKEDIEEASSPVYNPVTAP